MHSRSEPGAGCKAIWAISLRRHASFQVKLLASGFSRTTTSRWIAQIAEGGVWGENAWWKRERLGEGGGQRQGISKVKCRGGDRFTP
jgi:hypothetical protein